MYESKQHPTRSNCEDSAKSATCPAVILPRQGRQINHVCLKITSKHTDGDYLVLEVEHEPGDGIPLHVHQNEDEITYIVEGEVELTVGDDVSQVGPGSTAFLPRNVPHGYRAIGTQKVKMLWMVSPGGGFEEMLDEFASQQLDLNTMASTARKYGIEFLET